MEKVLSILPEIPKMKLIALQNSSMEAKFANAQYNTFTGFLAAKVKEFQLEGKVIIKILYTGLCNTVTLLNIKRKQFLNNIIFN